MVTAAPTEMMTLPTASTIACRVALSTEWPLHYEDGAAAGMRAERTPFTVRDNCVGSCELCKICSSMVLLWLIVLANPQARRLRSLVFAPEKGWRASQL
jgi:hypothetical protein